MAVASCFNAASPGICCCPLSKIRCGLTSAIRMRSTAKCAVRRPFVPRRQLTSFQDGFGRPRQGVRDRMLARPAVTGNRKNRGDTMGISTSPRGRQPSPSDPGYWSSFPARTVANQPELEPPRVLTSAIPTSGNWRVCPASKHIVAPPTE